MAKAKKLGKLNISEMRNLINKKAGMDVAHNLTQDNPTEVKDWIPTGSRWLDSIICRGKPAGIPIGKVVEIAGLEGSGKSYMAAQIAANAQKKDIDVIYFDSESAIDPSFLQNAGCDIGRLLYVQAQSVEFVLETIEELLGSNDNRMLFVWDSLALTPAISDVDGDFNPQSSMAVKARILAKGMSKLTVPIANSQSTFLVLNQLKTNIPQGPAGRIAAMINPYTTPGGKAMHYAYSLRVWLTGRKSKASYISDDKGFRVGSEVKVKLKKSRFGTEGRECTFKIVWAGDVGIQDQESWLEAIKGSDNIIQRGAWYELVYEDGSTEKFQAAKWLEKLQSENFKSRVMQIMDEEIIMRFEKKEGNAEDFYNVDPE
jgi:recombination protein RecA